MFAVVTSSHVLSYATNPPGATSDEIKSASELLQQLNRFATFVDFERTYLHYSGETPDAPGLLSDP